MTGKLSKLLTLAAALATVSSGGYLKPALAQVAATNASETSNSAPSQNAASPNLPLSGSASQTRSIQTTGEKRLRIGLALGGGGTRGIAHLGVLKVLEAEGIHVDCIAGTSMGAIVGGLYAAGMNAADVQKLCYSKSFLRSFDTVPIAMRVALIPVFFVPHLFGYHPYDGLYRGNKFRNFLNSSVSLQSRSIEELSMPFCAVASNLVDGKPYIIKSGNLGKAVQASSAVPQLRRPVFFNEKTLLVDGGLTNNLPVGACRALGADIVIAVDVDEQLGHVQPDKFRKIGSVAKRSLNMYLAQIDAPELRDADVVIHPNVDGIELMSRKHTDMDNAVKEGIKATQAAIPLIRQQIDKKLCNTDGTGKEL